MYLSPFMPLKSKEVFKLFDNLDDIDLFHFDNFEKIKSLNYFLFFKTEPRISLRDAPESLEHGL